MLHSKVVLSQCVLLFIRLITNDPHIEEIDFEHNYMGDAAGREILHAMQQRTLEKSGLKTAEENLNEFCWTKTVVIW